MKRIVLLLLCLGCSYAYADKATFEKLSEVNKCWLEQKDISVSNLPQYKPQRSEEDWIKLHLALVEKTLRQRKYPSFTKQQLQNRLYCLDQLHAYWQAGRFPINEDYSFRTPIFIDQYDNFCAVGFLLKASGYEQVSREIAAQTKLAYVKDMAYPALSEWAQAYGFTKEELAWIQPGYAPSTQCEPIGKGVDGSVQELYVDEATEQMYVGGTFVTVDDTILANNIAYLTEAAGVYTWHNMGLGVNGSIHAITKFDDKIFVGGHFDLAGGAAAQNIAYWNGSSWSSAGCLDGTVMDLLVFKDKLYAAGAFKNCTATTEANFAEWDGTEWSMIEGLSGRVNTLEVLDTSMLLGGSFNFDTLTAVNAIQWNSSTSFQTFKNKLRNEVMDFELFRDTLYAACKVVNTADANGFLMMLDDNFWQAKISDPSIYSTFYGVQDTLSFNSLCKDSAVLNIGGRFDNRPMIGTVASNCYKMGSYSSDWVLVDSTVNKMLVFKKDLIIAGLFKMGYKDMMPYGGRYVSVNGITKLKMHLSGIEEATKATLSIYPNPAEAGKLLTISNNFEASHYALHSINGKILFSGELQSNTQIRLPELLAKGMYFVRLSDKEGHELVDKLIVE